MTEQAKGQRHPRFLAPVVTLPPSSLSPPPRVLVYREGVHPIFNPGYVEKHHRVPFSPPNGSFYPTLVTWTLGRQLMSVLMILVGRAPPRLHRVHQRDKYNPRHMTG